MARALEWYPFSYFFLTFLTVLLKDLDKHGQQLGFRKVTAVRQKVSCFVTNSTGNEYYVNRNLPTKYLFC
jgi:hypothetical protein